MKPIIAEFGAEKNIPVMVIDLGGNDPLAEEYGVELAPTTMLLKNGREVNRSTPTSREDLDRLLILG